MDYNEAITNQFLAKRKALYGATDAIPMLQIRYIGDDGYCKITVSSTDITSSTGDTDGSETADCNFGTSGKIETSATTHDTLGELVDAINGYDDYECIQRHGLRADSVNNKTLDAAAADAKSTSGVTIYWDTSACAHAILSVTNLHTAFTDYTPGNLPSDPYSVDDGWTHGIFGGTFKGTMTTNAGDIIFYDGATQVYTQDAANTTVEKELDFRDTPVEGSSGEIFSVKLYHATDLSAAEVALRAWSVQK